MTKLHQDNQDAEPFFITEEVAAEMIAGGYEFEPPPNPCIIRLRDVPERMTDAELTLQSDEIAEQERERRRCKPCSTLRSDHGIFRGTGSVCKLLSIKGFYVLVYNRMGMTSGQNAFSGTGKRESGHAAFSCRPRQVMEK